MRTTIDIDPALLAQAQQLCGQATKKQVIEDALRLWIRLRRQHDVDEAFGRYGWRGDLAERRKGRGATTKRG
jgi:Arc/MetJ family transcription regulator